MVATKGANTRHGPDIWAPVGRPEYLRQCVLMSMRRLGVERIDLWQLIKRACNPRNVVSEQKRNIAIEHEQSLRMGPNRRKARTRRIASPTLLLLKGCAHAAAKRFA